MWNSASEIWYGRSSALRDALGGHAGPRRRRSSAPAAVHQQQELVAALAREDVAAADELGDAARRLAQHLVTGGVAERVVDELEVVEIEVEEGDGLARAAGPREVGAQLLLELGAVRQAGERGRGRRGRRPGPPRGARSVTSSPERRTAMMAPVRVTRC